VSLLDPDDGGRAVLQIERGHPHDRQTVGLEPLFPEVVGGMLAELPVLRPVVLEAEAGARFQQVDDAEEVSVEVEHRCVDQQGRQTCL
jgi:hypothetical protein